MVLVSWVNVKARTRLALVSLENEPEISEGKSSVHIRVTGNDVFFFSLSFVSKRNEDCKRE